MAKSLSQEMAKGRVIGRANGYSRQMNPMPSRTAAVADGVASGVFATLVMTVVLEAGRRLTSFRTQPETLIVRTVLGGSPSRRLPAEPVLAAVAHLAYGASNGALFALLTRSRQRTGPLGGVGYGLALWSASYLGWVPAVGAMARPERDVPGRQWSLVGAHVVYGGVLAATLRSGRRRADSSAESTS